MLPTLTFSPGPPMGPGSPFAPVRPCKRRERAGGHCHCARSESFSSIPCFFWGCSHGGGLRVGISLCHSATIMSQNKLGLVPAVKPTGGTGELGQHHHSDPGAVTRACGDVAILIYY